MEYDGFAIESFEAGQGLWHARIRRTDGNPVVIDGVPFSELEVGLPGPVPISQLPMPRRKSTVSTGATRRLGR